MALCESHLRDEILDAEIRMEGYRIFRSDRQSGIKKGGVIMYLRDDFGADVKILSSGSTGEVEWLALKSQRRRLVLITIYRPPTCSTQAFRKALEEIQNALDMLSAPQPTIIMTGDLNFPLLDWVSEEVAAGTTDMRSQAELFLEFAHMNMIEQYVREPTREDNLLDVVLCNDNNVVIGTRVDDTILSDHRLLTTRINLPCFEEAGPGLEAVREGLGALNFHHDHVDWDKVNQDFAEINWVHELADKNAEDSHQIFVDRIREVCWAHYPVRRRLDRSQLNHPKRKKNTDAENDEIKEEGNFSQQCEDEEKTVRKIDGIRSKTGCFAQERTR